MGKYEDLLQQLRDQGLDDLAEDFSEFSATSLRQKAASYDTVLKENSELRNKVTELIEIPKKEQAFRKAGVDFEALRPAEKDLLRKAKPDGEITEEWVAKVISEYELPVTVNEESSEEEPASAGVVEAAKSAPTGVRSGSTITPTVAAKWTPDRMMAFAEKYPEAWESLKKGETVTGIAF